ncbi:MAG: NAD(P)H-hydrate dehydratase [Saprospiraceae bacterium]|nr:NAD(P)H-hydrate dehydratase [Saprospiraceae bacterium]
MKILNNKQIKDWDKATILEKQISSLELMEKAAWEYSNWFEKHCPPQKVLIVCGIGNNGGDGLAIARILSSRHYEIHVCILGDINNGTSDFKINYQRILNDHYGIKFKKISDLTDSQDNHWVMIDALFGTGINRPLTQEYANAIDLFNRIKTNCYSVDLPSGLMSDEVTPWHCIESDFIGTFGTPKLSFFMKEHEKFVKKWQVIDIGLSNQFYKNSHSPIELLNEDFFKNRYSKRNRFAHKGNYGSGLLIAGNETMPGAAVLASKAALRSGIGKVFLLSLNQNHEIFHTSCPELIISTDFRNLDKFQSIAIGPGIGTNQDAVNLVDKILDSNNPIIIDADALNIISSQSWQSRIPEDSIITPHLGEFNKLFGSQSSSLDYWNSQIEFSKKLKITILLKGAYSSISDKYGNLYINSSGNPGMATAGSGDVLTGILLGMACQPQFNEFYVQFACYMHGRAADLALEIESEESLIASDIVQYLGRAFKEFCN